MRKFVVMGVAGCGKTSIGTALAQRLNAVYIDGDDLHPNENVEKMSRGEPLTDEDRAPWLARVAKTLQESRQTTFIGCSALRRIYRDWIRNGVKEPVTFLHLTGSRDVIAKRMAARKGHFMPASLLDSQFATLEPPQTDELSISIDIDQEPEAIITTLLSAPALQGAKS